MTTRTSFLKLIKICIVGFFLLVLAGYAVWRSLNYAKGPDVIVTDPQDGQTIETGIVLLNGIASRVNDIEINGRSIIIDEQGNFKESLILHKGMNIITLVARDQFGRETLKTVHLLHPY